VNISDTAILGALTGKAGITEVTFVQLCPCVIFVKALLIHEAFTTVFNLAHIWSQLMWSVVVQHVTLDAAPVVTFATNFTLDLFVNPHVASRFFLSFNSILQSGTVHCARGPGDGPNLMPL